MLTCSPGSSWSACTKDGSVESTTISISQNSSRVNSSNIGCCTTPSALHHAAVPCSPSIQTAPSENKEYSHTTRKERKGKTQDIMRRSTERTSGLSAQLFLQGARCA